MHQIKRSDLNDCVVSSTIASSTGKVYKRLDVRVEVEVPVIQFVVVKTTEDEIFYDLDKAIKRYNEI